MSTTTTGVIRERPSVDQLDCTVCSMFCALFTNFLGKSPKWYKMTIITFLIINPMLLGKLGESGHVIVGWLLIGEFIFTLAMALKCYPLLPGGVLAIEAILMGLTETDSIYEEAASNFPVILLLMFMVAGIYFMKDFLLYVFTKILINVRSKIVLSLTFLLLSAFMSAFLDALTVTAVLIAVASGFYAVYHRAVSSKLSKEERSSRISGLLRRDLEQFRGFLRSLLMHGAVGTALGGVTTVVGEPQNLLIAHQAGWHFIEFFLRMAPVTMPVLAFGLVTVVFLEKTKLFGYGVLMPASVFKVLRASQEKKEKAFTQHDKLKLMTQAAVGIFLIFALALHLAEVGLIGLAVIVFLTVFNGITEESQIGKAFEEALPFTALLVVFFTIVSVIHHQHLFTPIIEWALKKPESVQPGIFFIANGVLSAISDNVFVATVYINEVKAALDAGTISLEHFNKLVIAINTGTNLPSVATPNGQAAFLFLLTSAVAPILRLSYGKMVWMALPYTIVLSIVGMFGVVWII